MLLNSILCPRPEASSCLEIWSIPLLPTIAHSTPPHPYHNFTTFNSMHLTEPCIWNQPWNEQVSADASGPLTWLSLCHFPSQSLQQTPPPPEGLGLILPIFGGLTLPYLHHKHTSATWPPFLPTCHTVQTVDTYWIFMGWSRFWGEWG